MWREGLHGNNYKYLDRLILQQFQIGGTGINVNLFVGIATQYPSSTVTVTQATVTSPISLDSTAMVLPGMYVAGPNVPQNTTVAAKTASTVTLTAATTSPSAVGDKLIFYTDPSQPPALNQSAQNIQDLLFLENRDRKYDPDVYNLRAHYRISDSDFDLSQFGLFLTGDTIFMTVHLNDMVEKLGRKLMVGDVIELPHLKDYYPLDDGLQAALKRYYVVQDATKSAEGFSATWWPHLWRIKLQPMVDAQEFKDILNHIAAGSNTSTPVGDILSTLQNYLNVNDAVVESAENDVPYSGYDTSTIYHTSVTPSPARPGGLQTVDASTISDDASNEARDASNATLSSTGKVQGYLTGDGKAPNGMHTAAGVAFPNMPTMGDFFLRLDYVPNRLFRFNGARWVKVEDAVRTNLTPGASNNGTQMNGFINNEQVRYTDKLGWDVITVADPYAPEPGAVTTSFTLSTKTILTTFPWTTSIGVKAKVNGGLVKVTTSSDSGMLSFVIESAVNTGDQVEYAVFKNTIREKQNINTALRPDSDN